MLLKQAIDKAAAELVALAASQTHDAAEILEFQLEMLGDDGLSAPAFAEIGAGASAHARLERSARRACRGIFGRRRRIFSRPRQADLIDLRDRVLRLIGGD